MTKEEIEKWGRDANLNINIRALCEDQMACLQDQMDLQSNGLLAGGQGAGLVGAKGEGAEPLESGG